MDHQAMFGGGPKIENLICFYDERVDAVEVDGDLQAKPITPWSS